jgi:nitrogen regulatory protein PII-like uncharacterized protein
MQLVTGGLRTRVQDVARKLGLPVDPSSLENISEESLTNILNQSKISEKEKRLFRSFIGAAKHRVGKMDVFAQMAAASGFGGDFAELVGGTGSIAGDKAVLQGRLKDLEGKKENKESLLGLIGATATEYLKSKGSRGRQLLLEVIKDEDLRLALKRGNMRNVIENLATKGITVSEKDLLELSGIVKSEDFNLRSDKDVETATNLVTDYEKAAKQLAGLQSRELLSESGSKLLAATDKAGRAGEAQKRLAKVLIDIGQGGFSDQKQEELRAAMKEYSEVLGGLKGDELDRALRAGGFAAEQALGASKKRKDLAGRSFKNVKEAAAALGVSEEDLALAGFQSGKLTKEQLDRFVLMGATSRMLVGSMGGAPDGKPQSETNKLVEAINTLNKNQSGIATLLATLSNDPDIKKKLETLLAGMNETGNAGPAGNTQLPGEQGQPKQGRPR